MSPPFRITNKILSLCSEISKIIGKFESFHGAAPSPALRRQNRVEAVQGSLAIEGNTLSLEQITRIMDRQDVAGDFNEILEARNAISAYDEARLWDATKEADLLKAHKVMMHHLIDDAGKYRAENVGIIKGSKVGHVAPKPNLVPGLMGDLFRFLGNKSDTPLLVKACVFHYELEFIHPFIDGNGRMGRLWQHVILLRESAVFSYVPIESMIKSRQGAYYQALASSDKAGESTEFIEFSLDAIRTSLVALDDQMRGRAPSVEDRLLLAYEHFGAQWFARKDYLNLFRTMSTATASRDLQRAVQSGRMTRDGEKSSTRYMFLSAKPARRS